MDHTITLVASLCVAVAATADARTRRVPAPTLSAVFLTLAATSSRAGVAALRSAVLGAAGFAAILFAVGLVAGAELGGGDIRVALLVGAVLPPHRWPAFFVAAGLVALATASFLRTRTAVWGERTAFTPVLLAGHVVAVLPVLWRLG